MKKLLTLLAIAAFSITASYAGGCCKSEQCNCEPTQEETLCSKCDSCEDPQAEETQEEAMSLACGSCGKNKGTPSESDSTKKA